MRYLFQMRALIQVTLGVILIVGLLSLNYAQTSNNEHDNEIAKELKKVEGYAKKGNYVKAIKMLEGMNHWYPENAKILSYLAHIKIAVAGYDQEGNFRKTNYSREAISHLEGSLKFEPDNLNNKILLAHLLDDFDEDDKAELMYSELLEHDEIRSGDDTRYMVINYVILLRGSDGVDVGLKELEKSLKVTDYDARIFHAYIAQLSLAKQYTKMLEEYARFESEKGFLDSIKYKVCMELLASKQFVQSKKCYQELLNADEISEYFRNRANIDFEYVQKQLASKK